jgi:hypothetical protein
MEEKMGTETDNDGERGEIINQASRDSSPNYCFVYNFLRRRVNSPGAKYERCCDGGCGSDGWCELRQTLYDSPQTNFTISQAIMMDRAKYGESEVEHKDLGETDAGYFWALESFGSRRFRAFWNSGIHLPNDLENFCVEPIIGHRVTT